MTSDVSNSPRVIEIGNDAAHAKQQLHMQIMYIRVTTKHHQPECVVLGVIQLNTFIN